MFRGFFFAVLLQVRGLWKRASWKPAMCLTWKPIVEWSLNHWNLWYILWTWLFQHLEKPPGDRFYKALTITRLSTTLLPILWNERLRVRRSVVSHILPGPWSTGSRNLSHHPVACLDGFIILPSSVLFLRDCPIAMEFAVPRNCFYHQACKSNFAFRIPKKHAPNPKRACMRISFGAWQGRPYCLVSSQLLDLQIQRCYHFNTPNRWFTDPKMPKIYKDCRMHQESCSTIIGLSHLTVIVSTVFRPTKTWTLTF